nr:type VI secretion system-associated protein VasI [uncultured Halomonas sp.]
MSPKLFHRAALTLTLLSLAGPAASADEPLTRATDCASVTPKLERLNCYDAVFRPVSDSAEGNTSRPSQWRAIHALEQGRGDDFTFRVEQTRNGDVLMSAPALGTLHPRPRMVISCENSITRFQIHIDKPLEEARLRIRLNASGNSIKQLWRVRDDGHVISGGRGLPAIETLRRLLDTDTLTLGSDIDRLDGLRFDFTDVRKRIAPLRDACRW